MLPDSAKPPQNKPPEHFYVHPDNWTAFRIFESCQTQWRVVAGMNGIAYQGLDYPSVLAVISAMNVKKPKRVFRQVQLIEAGALSEINNG